jgi:DNA-binding MarR family transcriptional regulator/N-acetylglutamate synthase-like GNAT family acetyltransferase
LLSFLSRVGGRFLFQLQESFMAHDIVIRPPRVEPDKQQIAAIRSFNRFYTQKIGVLQGGFLQSPFSLTEVRVLYELAHREKPTAAQLARDLGLDQGYLSRILRDFAQRGLIDKTPSEKDARQTYLSLTPQGVEVFAPLNQSQSDEVTAMLGGLSAAEQNRLLEAMRTIEDVLGPRLRQHASYVLRAHEHGDMGWVVHRHGTLYFQEYGWNEEFEALVAEIVAQFLRNFNPNRERCWIAESEGEIVGSVFLVQQSETVAKLRLLLVEPKARGLGLGARLVSECIRFAQQRRYQKITLWTNNVLVAAQRRYQEAGFRLVHEEPHHSFGHNLVGETWELDL